MILQSDDEGGGAYMGSGEVEMDKGDSGDWSGRSWEWDSVLLACVSPVNNPGIILGGG